MKDEKEEIKPAPLGEQKKDYTDADVAFANSFQRDNKHYIKPESLGESSEEQKREFTMFDNNEGETVIYRDDNCVVAVVTNYPTSEPPEEQEELVTILQERIARAFYAIENKKEDQNYPFDGRGELELKGMKRAYSDILTIVTRKRD